MGNVTKVVMIKVRYLGDFDEPFVFVGVATKTPYKFGGKWNLGDVDVRDLATGISTRPGLFELTDDKGQKLFEKHTPRERKKRETKVIEPVEEPSDAESPVPGD